MRILYLSASGELGGAERSLLDVIASLRRAQPLWPLHLMVAAQGPLAERASALGVTTEIVPFGNALSRLGESGGGPTFAAGLVSAIVPTMAYLARLRRTIRAFTPDLLHTNSLKMHVLAARARPKHAALIWHVHDYIGRRHEPVAPVARGRLQRRDREFPKRG
jgi:hypothetical protein